ncbi:MAG: hypothetical protein HYY98_10655 [Burkholderiales bacterium]|nr:hypothetical protein [Burkholderiales bacterium]
MTPALRALRRRLNAQAYDIVNEALARMDAENEALRAENERLRTQLAWAEDNAERWREDAIEALNHAADEVGGVPGLTMDGRLVVCMPQGAHA